ncbi:bluetail domain-containing putative surface protein [Synechococcus sp. 8F6]|uniref:bluetail domain-containing putative surface protein n=1 Tax=Synechococcus sp. 8F6 TaxID=2025606 RepID=UPI00117FC7FE|nr:bluetail domain-containing putative surface protein [Synechococcus sp. 8F6]
MLGTSGQPGFDRITDYAIGTDVIDGPSAVARGQVAQLAQIQNLNPATLSTHLAGTQFRANGASVFGLSGTSRWFLALNDNVAGYSSLNDGIVKITGFGGSLSDLHIV